MNRYFFLLCCFFFTLEGDLKEKILENSPPSWVLEQIHEDLQSIMPSDLSKEALDCAMEETSLELIRYKIGEGKLTVLDFTEKATHSNRMERLTKSLKDLVRGCGKKLPNCEFIVCLEDGYFLGEEIQSPIFCFCKLKSERKGILIPDTDILTHEKELKLQVKIGNQIYPWRKKKDKAFWRGTTTGGTITLENYEEFPRFQLVEVSSQSPNFVDAKFTKLVQGAENLPLTHLLSRHYSIPEHIKYKYQILVDGNTCSWSRAYWQLLSNCVLLKQNSDYIQWFYRALEPYVHYIPVSSDFNDLVEVIKWAKEHDAIVQEISNNAQKFAHSQMNYADHLHYFYLLLHAYSQIQSD